MENVVKANIGGVAFTLNTEAFTKLETFLHELENHYKSKPYGDEIMQDIEERMAELLLEQYSKEDVVTPERVDELMKIMGTPSDFYASDDETETTDNQRNTESKTIYNTQKKKRLYRDPENKFLGGVFGGLGHYFRIDAAFIRISFVLCLFLGYLSGYYSFERLSNFLIIAYLILWICIPRAKSYLEKCAMQGCDPGIRGAENISQPYRKSSSLDKLFRWLVGAFLIFVGIALLLSLTVALFFINDSSAWSAISIFSFNSTMLKPLGFLLLGLIAILPGIFFIYEGVRIIGRFKSPKWHPGLCIILLWLASFFLFAIYITPLFTSLKSKETIDNQRFTFNKYYDTLFVQHEPLPKEIDGQSIEWDKLNMNMNVDLDDINGGVFDVNDGTMYIGKDVNNTKYIGIYPSLKEEYFNAVKVIETDSTTSFLKDTTIRASATIKQTRWFGNQTKNPETGVKISDSLITLYPEIYTKKSKFKGITQSVKIELPDSCRIVTITPTVQ